MTGGTCPTARDLHVTHAVTLIPSRPGLKPAAMTEHRAGVRVGVGADVTEWLPISLSLGVGGEGRGGFVRVEGGWE